tara:strand:+ start:364 stop:633 length:270 start_codon:yes stop_codon:yes gene_type:complete
MNKYEAMRKLHPNIITIRGDIAYDENEQIVSYDEVAVQAVVDANAYKEARAKAYAPLAEQLDYIYHNGIEAWKTDMINPVKTKYPKGSV